MPTSDQYHGKLFSPAPSWSIMLSTLSSRVINSKQCGNNYHINIVNIKKWMVIAQTHNTYKNTVNCATKVDIHNLIRNAEKGTHLSVD